MAEDRKKKSRFNGSGIYIAAFFLCVILLIMMFFVKKDNILSNLKNTNFFERIGVSTPEIVSKHQDKERIQVVEEEYEFDLMGGDTKTTQKNAPIEVSGKKDSKVDDPPRKEIEVQADNPVDREIIAATKAAESVKTDNFDAKEPVKVKTVAAEAEKVPESVPKTRNTNLCFVNVDAEGRVNRKIISRAMPKTDSPLTDAIRALIKGPLPSESNCMNLIPSGTKLIGASVKNGIATLNFSDEFEINPVGVEGYVASLMQIVYTATEFSTVKGVQFMIEGEKRDYLAEGQWIGTPLTRNSF